MLTRKVWTRGPGTLPAVKGLVWYTDGFRTPSGWEKLEPECMGNPGLEGLVSV